MSLECGAEAGSHDPDREPAGTSCRKLASSRFHSDPTVVTFGLDGELPVRKARSRLPYHLRAAASGTSELGASDVGTCSRNSADSEWTNFPSQEQSTSTNCADYEKPKPRLLRKMSSVSSMTANSGAEAGGVGVLGDARNFLQRMGTSLLGGSLTANFARRSAFENQDELKDRITSMLDRSSSTWNVKDLYKSEGLAQRVAQSGTFQFFSLTLVVVYAGWVAVDAEFNEADTLDKAEPIFQAAEHIFCTLFSLELLVRFCAFRKCCLMCYDSWFVFDGALVLLMVAETWLMPIILLIADPNGDGLPNTSWVRLLRLIRLARLARTARLVNAFPELKVMIKGMLASLRSVLVTGLLLLLVLYVFGIGLKSTAKGTSGGETYFGSVPRAMYSLMIHATFMDGPSMVLDELDDISRFLFLVALVLSAMLLLNMLIGVMCEAVSNISSMEKERALKEKMTSKVRELLNISNLDVDNNGLISKTELLSLLESPDAAMVLHDAGVDMVGLLDISDLVFQSDTLGNEFDKELTFDEFMELLLALRGENTATVKDIVDFKKVMNTHFTAVSNNLAQMEARISRASKRPAGRSKEASRHKVQEPRVPDPSSVDPVAGGHLHRIKMFQRSWTHDNIVSTPGVPDKAVAEPLGEAPDLAPGADSPEVLCHAASAAGGCTRPFSSSPRAPVAISAELSTIVEGVRECGSCDSLPQLTTASDPIDSKSDDEDKLSSDKESVDAPDAEEPGSGSSDLPSAAQEIRSGSDNSSQELAIQRIESCLAALQQELVALKRGTPTEPQPLV